MSKIIIQLLKLINEGKTVSEISKILNMSHKQIYNLMTVIENKGFEFDRKYYYDGDIIYVPRKSLLNGPNVGVNIITEPSDEEFEALVISDLHIGSSAERLDLLRKAYNYCIKEGINIIIVCGDFIEGICPSSRIIHDNVHDQIDYAIRNYPFDNSILNFVVLGNHDYSSLINAGQNLERILGSYRHDIVSLGYFVGQINIKNDRIIIKHPWDKVSKLNIKQIDLDPECMTLCLSGHSHKMKVRVSNNLITFSVPSLSNSICTGEAQIPSMIRMNLKFKNGIIYYGYFHHLLVENGIKRISEFACSLGEGKEVIGKSIQLEEERGKRKVLE